MHTDGCDVSIWLYVEALFFHFIAPDYVVEHAQVVAGTQIERKHAAHRDFSDTICFNLIHLVYDRNYVDVADRHKVYVVDLVREEFVCELLHLLKQHGDQFYLRLGHSFSLISDGYVRIIAGQEVFERVRPFNRLVQVRRILIYIVQRCRHLLLHLEGVLVDVLQQDHRLLLLIHVLAL